MRKKTHEGEKERERERERKSKGGGEREKERKKDRKKERDRDMKERDKAEGTDLHLVQLLAGRAGGGHLNGADAERPHVGVEGHGRVQHHLR